MSLNTKKLLNIQKEQKKLKEEVHEVIYMRCKKYIESEAIKGEVNCTFTIPSFIFGYTPINISLCMEYMLKLLNEQIYAYAIEENKIYISWEACHIKK